MFVDIQICRRERTDRKYRVRNRLYIRISLFHQILGGPIFGDRMWEAAAVALRGPHRSVRYTIQCHLWKLHGGRRTPIKQSPALASLLYFWCQWFVQWFLCSCFRYTTNQGKWIVECFNTSYGFYTPRICFVYYIFAIYKKKFKSWKFNGVIWLFFYKLQFDYDSVR